MNPRNIRSSLISFQSKILLSSDRFRLYFLHYERWLVAWLFQFEKHYFKIFNLCALVCVWIYVTCVQVAKDTRRRNSVPGDGLTGDCDIWQTQASGRVICAVNQWSSCLASITQCLHINNRNTNEPNNLKFTFRQMWLNITLAWRWEL